MTQILVTKPDVLNQRDKAALRKAGVVVVEADDPSAVKLLQPDAPEITGNDMLWAALKGLNAPNYEHRAVFAKCMLSAMEANRK